MNIEKLLGKPQKIELDDPTLDQMIEEWRKNLAKHMRSEVYIPANTSVVQANELKRKQSEAQSHLCVAIAHLGHLRMMLEIDSPEYKAVGRAIYSCFMSYHQQFPTTKFDVQTAHSFGITLYNSQDDDEDEGGEHHE